jgi:hypothetical protein
MMKPSIAYLVLAAALAACETMTAAVEDEVPVGQAMYSILLGNEYGRVCTFEDHLEKMKTGVYNGCTFCQVPMTDDIVAAVNDAVLKGPIPAPDEPMEYGGMVPNNDIITAVMIDSRGRSLVYTDFYVRGFDGQLRQRVRYDQDYNTIWSLSDEVSDIRELSTIRDACNKARPSLMPQ